VLAFTTIEEGDITATRLAQLPDDVDVDRVKFLQVFTWSSYLVTEVPWNGMLLGATTIVKKYHGSAQQLPFCHEAACLSSQVVDVSSSKPTVSAGRSV